MARERGLRIAVRIDRAVQEALGSPVVEHGGHRSVPERWRVASGRFSTCPRT